VNLAKNVDAVSATVAAQEEWIMRVLLSLLLTAWIGAAAAQQPSPSPLHPPFAASDAQQIIPRLADALEQNYVFVDIGKRYATMLRASLAAGRYASFPDSGAFAERVTADLQAVARDAHLVLIAPRTDRPAADSPSSAVPDQPPPIGKAGWIAPGVAYIEFHSFPSDDQTLAKLREFLRRHAGARVLIIDTVNEHSGGWVGEADVLFRELFSRPRDLVAIDIRKAVDERIGGLPTGPSIRKADAPAGVVRYIHSVTPSPDAGLRNTKVYVLISNRTISAGEHLVFALKQSHRATLIGERTRGAGHVENDVPMPGGYTAVIPFGRAYDPRTGKGWEGVGVLPDLRVPAGKALQKALDLAGVKVRAEDALNKLREE
jgi:Peptidase family S41/N-terminal domain of Peptidase_S41 in eukaryotic IRBP